MVLFKEATEQDFPPLLMRLIKAIGPRYDVTIRRYDNVYKPHEDWIADFKIGDYSVPHLPRAVNSSMSYHHNNQRRRGYTGTVFETPQPRLPERPRPVQPAGAGAAYPARKAVSGCYAA